MSQPRLVLCSGAKVSDGDHRGQGRLVLHLDALGQEPTVNIRIQDVAKVVAKAISQRMTDLLEIAAYVFSADCATPRGTGWSDSGSKEAWTRDFHFVIPVRDKDFWAQDKVCGKLAQALSFLTDDDYAFDFELLRADRPVQQYLTFADYEEWPFYAPKRILMFSGGLDSLAGAVEEGEAGSKLVLVSHRSYSVMAGRQKALVGELHRRYPGRVVHVPVWVNKVGGLADEPTQRSRSFLYVALGTVLAELLNGSGIRFFENGVISLNLPLADEAIRARASRTTHPLTLAHFGELMGLVVGRDLPVDNPYIFRTKQEVVSAIADCGATDLIGKTVSCVHSLFRPRTQPHCGKCSQCVDRRVAVVSAGLQDWDPDTDYTSDVFTGPREELYDRNIAIDYAQRAFELHELAKEDIAQRFNLELCRAARPLGKGEEVFDQLIGMLKRHSSAVVAVLTAEARRQLPMHLERGVDPTSMVGLLLAREHREPSWCRYAQHIAEILAEALPPMCLTEKPHNEPRLQELCEGVLRSHHLGLIREFPFFQWGIVKTKADWSADETRLLVELKYARKAQDKARIAEGISADITKYGDSGQRVLFLVYDPGHIIVDGEAFRQVVERRPGMMLRFIR